MFNWLLFIWFLFFPVNGLIWILGIRLYLKKVGRCPWGGANYGWAAIKDAEIAGEIAKSKNEKPWCLRIFWLILYLQFLIPLGLFIFIAWKNT